MADISTAVSMARVPILGEDGRISDDYIPAAIGENVTKAEAAATRAETAATDAEGSASAARQSATQAASIASEAGASASQAQQSAAAASGAVTQAQSAKQAAEKAKTAAETAQSAAAGSAQDAQQSATAAASSAASVADKFISSAQATTLEPGSQATASVEDQVLTIGVPRGEKGDKGDTGDTGKQGVQGDKGDPGTAATIAVGSVTGLAAGASPTVVNSGTANAAVLDFGIPKGDKGDKGDTGIGVPEGGEPGQLLSKTDSGTAWVDPPSGNVLTGTSTGLVAHGEDAYAQKPIEVRVKGKTWVNRWPVLSGTNNGITVATDGTGLVTVTGTATADADVTADVSGCAAGKSYTTMVSATPTGCSAYFEVQKPSGNTSINATTTGATLNVASDATSCVAGVHVASGTTVNASFRVMLVDGTEVPDCFTPPASIASVETGNLVTAGKNLLDFSKFNPAYYDVSGDGLKIVKADDQPWSTIQPMLQLPPGDYTLSCEGATSTQIATRYVGDTGWNSSSSSSSSVHLSALSEIAVKVFADVGTAVYPQLELGSTATAYEPPNVTQTPLPEVELRSLPNGTCDELVIKADGTCEVERNTVQVTFDGSEDENWGKYTQNTSAFTAYCVNFFADSPINAGTNQATSAAAVVCRELPVIQGGFDLSIPNVAVSHQATNSLYVTAPSTVTDIDSFKQWLAVNPITCVVNVNEKPDEPQSPVTLPTLPAPNFNQYHDSPVPSDTTVTYERDLNIVIDNLAKQIAGTAATVAINEATR